MTEPTSTRGLAFSCLCVTEDRPDFREWLLWNYRKQDHPHRELVVVDSSDPPLRWPDEAGLRVVRCDHGTPIPVKRNLAMRHAVGEAITWFDDDDWQHPRKLSLLAAALVGSTIAGNSRAPGSSTSCRGGHGDTSTGRTFRCSTASVWRGPSPPQSPSSPSASGPATHHGWLPSAGAAAIARRRWVSRCSSGSATSTT